MTAAPTRSRPRSSREAGQGLVEFALVFPIFFLVLMGMIDFGQFVYINSALSQAAREGTRLAAAEVSWIGLSGASGPGCVSTPSQIGASNPGAHVCPPTVASFKADVVAAVNRMAVGLGQFTSSSVYLSCNAGSSDDPVPTGMWTEVAGGSSPQYGNGCEDASGQATASAGDEVSVRIVYTYRTITPIISSFLASQTLTASATMVIN